MRQCAIDGCSTKVLARGLCNAHYYKAKRAGTIDQIAPNPSGPCEHCGQPMPAGRRWGSRFCSIACKQHAADAAVAAQTLANKMNRPRSCAWCKEPMPPEKRANARFCTVECDNAWHNHEKAAVRRNAVAASRPPCEVCKGPIGASRSSKAIYCSAVCKSRAQMTGSPAGRARIQGSNLQYLYGLTIDDFERMLADQGGRCAICGTTEPGGKGQFHVDHCHTTKVVRGLLCHHCNLGLGHFKDAEDRLQAAIEYLRRQNGEVSADAEDLRLDRSVGADR